ncbi:MAG: hypothetical protein IJ583_10000 [Firmicutes bacterium]|nr:hypothetical protein [Bacillota bacterium]
MNFFECNQQVNDMKYERPLFKDAKVPFVRTESFNICAGIPDGIYDDRLIRNIETTRVSDDDSFSMMNEAENFMKDVKIRSKNGMLYFFADGYYESISINEARALIMEQNYNNIPCNNVSKYVNEMYKILVMHPKNRVPKEYDESRFVAFNNCIYDTESNLFYENNGDIFVTSKINCNYKSYMYIPGTPAFDNFLYEVSGGDVAVIKLLWEVLGYCLTYDTLGQCFFVMQGRAGSGKSTFGEVLRNLFMGDAVVGLGINELEGRFNTYPLSKARINIGMDLPGGKITDKAASVLKAITGNDIYRMEGKFKDPMFDRTHCKFIFSSNFPVVTNIFDEGFARRLIIIPFNYAVAPENMDRHIVTKILEEKDEIVFKALCHYNELKCRNYVFTKCAANNNYTQNITDYMQDTDIEKIAESYLRECFVTVSESKIPNYALYERFKSYCLNIGIQLHIPQEATTVMLKRICCKYNIPAEFKKIKYGGQSLNGVCGLAFKEMM